MLSLRRLASTTVAAGRRIGSHHHHHLVNRHRIFSTTSVPTANTGGDLSNAKTASRGPKPLSLDTIKALPKAELHQHLDGSVRTSTVLDLGYEQRVQLPTHELKELHNLVTVKGNAISLETYLTRFDLINSVLQKPYALTRVTYEACEDAARDGVKHLELRFSPILHTLHGAPLTEIMEAVCEGAQLGASAFHINVGVIVCAMRHLSPDISTTMAELAWRFRDRGVVGFDIAGPEKGYRASAHKVAFELARNKQLGVTVHSGEADDSQSIQDAIHNCGARRIGHGVYLRESAALRNFVADNYIALEMCPTSNLQTGAIAKISEHPIYQFFREGLMVVPCSDNTSVSQTTLSQEYQLLQESLPFSNADMIQMIDYGFRSAFANGMKKKVQRRQALRQIRDVLKSENYEVEQTPYLKRIGFFNEPLPRLWAGYEPTVPVSRALISALPKAELNCRLDEALSVETLFALITESKITLRSLGFDMDDSYENLRKVVKEVTNPDRVRSLFRSVLQTPKQLHAAVKDVYTRCKSIVYTELQIRLNDHVTSMTPTAVIETVLESISRVEAEMSSAAQSSQFSTPQVSLVIYVDARDSPRDAYEAAKLAIAYKNKGVVGFGFYTQEDLTAAEYADSFALLRQNNVPIAVAANSVDGMRKAISQGARRLVGAADLHLSHKLMDFVANNRILIEVEITEAFVNRTRSIRRIGHPIRLYLDKGIPVTISGLRESDTLGPVEILEHVCKEANLSGATLLTLLSNAMQENFLPIKKREDLVGQLAEKYRVASSTVTATTNNTASPSPSSSSVSPPPATATATAEKKS